jgi:hypothetical protein
VRVAINDKKRKKRGAGVAASSISSRAQCKAGSSKPIGRSK